MPIGSTLASEHYTAALITNPWMVKWRERLPVAHLMGLVLDLIPNLFGVLVDDGKPFVFAHQHQQGFKYDEEFCDTVADHLRGHEGGIPRPRSLAGALAPTDPRSSRCLPSRRTMRSVSRRRPASPTRAARIALAACFDPRKGLRELPALLNGLADVVDEVVVYGGVRCRKSEAEAFFANLRIERIVWHLGATAHRCATSFGAAVSCCSRRASRVSASPCSRHSLKGAGSPHIR